LPLLPKSDEELVEELSAMMMAYLQRPGPKHRSTPARTRSGLFEGLPVGTANPPKL
jgi:hypothetical protein